MKTMQKILRTLGASDTKPARQRAQRSTERWQPAVESLEDRWVPSGVSSITSNFNGTAIPAGDTVWFSSVFKINGLGSNPVTLHVTNQTISYAVGGVNETVAVPDSDITLSPTATTATTTFDTATNTWDTTLPFHFSGNAFLGGVALPVPNGLPGGLNPVTWQGQFSSDTAGLTINWQWGAAVYQVFSTDYTLLNVKPVDDNHVSQYQNSDHAGTPEAFKQFVTGGARGGGGSNFTGSYSATASISPTLNVPPPPTLTSSLSGFALNMNTHTGFAGVTITLTGTDANGNSVTMVTTTGLDGSYSFNGLAAGTYTLTATIPNGYVDSGDMVGTVNGNTDGIRTMAGQLGDIVLNSGDNGINYDFGFFALQG
jgi:hypothetical protein